MNNTDEKKLTDKAFSHAIISSIVGIVVCLICLCSSTWAWFTDSVEIAGGTIKAGECLLEIDVTNEIGEEMQDVENGITLNANETYTVTLTLPKDSTSGYCKIVTDMKSYYSDYILYHDSDTPVVVTFRVQAESTQQVKFVKCWGVYSCTTDVTVGETLVLPVTA